jgi:hypothetical protein
MVRFPPDLPLLIMRGDRDGAVVAELRSSEAVRTLSLASGRYFVHVRGKDVLYEAELEVASGVSRELRLADMQSVAYARLVRKGNSERRAAQALYVGALARSALDASGSACLGLAAGFALELAQLGLRLQLSGCGAAFANPPLRASVGQYAAQLDGFHTWDTSLFSFSLGVGAGVSLFRQSFTTRGEAPDRSALAPFIAVAAALERDITSNTFARLEVAGETHFLRLRGEQRAPASTATNFAAAVTLALGLRL